MPTDTRAAVLALAGSTALILTACNISIDTTETVTESFDVSDFTEIDVAHAFDASVSVGDATSVEIEVDEELLDRLSVEVDGETLVVRLTDGLVATSGPLRLNITTPSLEAVTIAGAADMEIEGLNGESFDLRTNGAANISATGSIEALTIEADGASKIDLDGLTIGQATVDVDGASRVEFDELDRIDGQVSGASSVDVADGTTVDVETSGASSIG